MKLYSIRHKITGKFFILAHYNGDLQWNKTPHYWTTIDGIKQNLIKMSSEMYFPFKNLPPSIRTLEELNNHMSENYLYSYRDRAWKNMDALKLKNIEVIITNVSVLGEKTLHAEEFMKELETAWPT